MSSDLLFVDSPCVLFTLCRAPFKPGPDLDGGLCKIPCPAEENVVEKGYIIAFKVVLYISLTVEYLCCFIIFFTWTRDRNL